MPKLKPATMEKEEPAVFLTKQQLADRYAVTIGCVNNWMREGRIPYLRLSKQLVRFNLAAIDAALQRYEVRGM